MKIWNIPPEYLDNATLIAELRTLDKLFWEIADTGYRPQNDAIFSKYILKHRYILKRLLLDCQELDKRKLEYSVSELALMLERLEHDSDDHVIVERDIVRDIELLFTLWQEYIDFDASIPGRIEKLSMIPSASEIKQELEYNLSQISQEIGV